MSTIYFHNASSVMVSLFRLVAPFMDPVTRAKIVFLPSDPAAAAEVLARDFDVAMLPPNLGGSSPPRPVEVAWAETLARRAAAAAAAAGAAAPPPVAAVDAAAVEVGGRAPSAASSASLGGGDALVTVVPAGDADGNQPPGGKARAAAPAPAQPLAAVA